MVTWGEEAGGVSVSFCLNECPLTPSAQFRILTSPEVWERIVEIHPNVHNSCSFLLYLPEVWSEESVSHL